MYTIYAIYSKVDFRIYVGFTSDLKQKLKDHNAGRTKSTKGYVPWKIFYTEEAETRTEARKREKYLKGGSGKEKLKRLLEDLK